MKRIKLNHSLLTGLCLGFSLHAIAGYPVDINSASVDELANALDGVGQSKAEAIVAFRDQYGPFMEAQELIQVQGIGNSTVERNRENILLSPNPEKASQ